MDPIGKSPIPVFFLILAKAALLGSSFFFIIRIINPGSILYISPFTTITGIIIYSAGLFFVTLSIINLGSSISVGLPREKTILKTGGLYTISRNPIYFGAFMICVGSCLIAIHPLNFLFFTLVVLIHHRIIKKEEKFLEGRFGEAWLNYKQHVNRYLGRKKLNGHRY